MSIEIDDEVWDCESVCSETEDNEPEPHDREEDELEAVASDDEDLFQSYEAYYGKNGISCTFW